MIAGAKEAGVSPIVGSFPRKEAALVEQLFTAVYHQPWINLPSIHQKVSSLKDIEEFLAVISKLTSGFTA
ncbi:hypothetical protein LguiA_007357 [Lonicera macranthoides]